MIVFTIRKGIVSILLRIVCMIFVMFASKNRLYKIKVEKIKKIPPTIIANLG
jgi:hypothetical protein